MSELKNSLLLRHLLKSTACVAIAFNASSASAVTFNVGEIEGSLDTNLSIGAGWRISGIDERQLSQGNLGQSPGSSIGASTNNNDDGNWNFDKGDTYSKIFKGASELSLETENFGAIVGAKYYYDFEIKDESRAKDDNGFRRSFNDTVLDNAGSGIDLMNAYIFGSWDISDDYGPVSMKLGQHVISWGEGLFIPGGINIINPFDVAAARTPGAELKDILLPVNLVSLSSGIGDNLSLEAFYQLDWKETKIDSCGTFFSFHDYIAEGCGPSALTNDADPIALSGLVASRVKDEKPDDSDQFGVSLRWYIESLNGSEVSFYYMQYHSRLPFISGYVADPFQTSPKDNLPTPGLPSYFVEYPDRIKMYGIGLNGSNDAGYSFGAEYSFRENQPIQWNGTEILAGGVLLPYSRLLNRNLEDIGGGSPLLLAGQRADGFDRYNVSQLQLSTIKIFDYVLGASRMTFLAEGGAVYVHDLPSLDKARYGRPDHFGSGDFGGLGQVVTDPLTGATFSCDGSNALFAANPNPSFCDRSGYTTPFSWGYTVAAILDYESVFPGVNLQPELALSHDVNGNSPEPLGLFVEGRKAFALTLKATYQNTYQGSLGFVNYVGGGRNNLLNDRDHVTANISVSF